MGRTVETRRCPFRALPGPAYSTFSTEDFMTRRWAVARFFAVKSLVTPREASWQWARGALPAWRNAARVHGTNGSTGSCVATGATSLGSGIASSAPRIGRAART